jgi:hypothetical protein
VLIVLWRAMSRPLGDHPFCLLFPMVINTYQAARDLS